MTNKNRRTLEAMEMREDLYLSQVAEKLDVPNCPIYDHDDVWK